MNANQICNACVGQTRSHRTAYLEEKILPDCIGVSLEPRSSVRDQILSMSIVLQSSNSMYVLMMMPLRRILNAFLVRKEKKKKEEKVKGII